jgi:hypothetical protein
MHPTDDVMAYALPAMLLTSDDMVCCPPVVMFYQTNQDIYDRWMENVQWCILMGNHSNALGS